MNKEKALKRGREMAEQLFLGAADNPELGSMSFKELGRCLKDPAFQKMFELLQRMSFSLLIPYFLDSYSKLELLSEPTTDAQKTFIKQYGIREEDKRIVQALAMGATFDNINKKAKVSRRKAQDRLDLLCEEMGLSHRRQLFFVFGWMRLIPLELDCLGKSE